MQVSYRRKWMLAGFAAAFLVGDLFLTLLKAGSDMDSTGYVIGVAGFALAQVFWTIGQLREARPDLRVALALAIPLATSGGALILIARFRKGPDLAWTCWLVLLVIVFALCIDLDAIPFSPYVTTEQKLLIVSFAAWSARSACLAGMRRKDASHPCSQSLRAAACGLDCEIRQQRKKNDNKK